MWIVETRIRRRQFFGEARVAGVLRGLQNRCRSVSQAEVGSIPTLSANSSGKDLGKCAEAPKWDKIRPSSPMPGFRKA